MLYRIGPAMLSLALAGIVPRCTHFPEGDGGFDGYAGASGTSVGGVAGAKGGSAGTSSHGGGAGSSGVGGAAGLGAGLGGESGISGGGSSNGGLAGMSGAGTSGALGSGGAANTGGTAGSGGGSATGHLVVSTLGVSFPVATCNGIASPPQSFTLSNGFNAPIDWGTTLTESFPFFSIAPTGSSLLPGETVTVTVSPLALAPSSLPPNFQPNFSGTIAISGDSAGTQFVSVSETVTGIDITWTPTTLDFGMVPIGSGPPVGNPAATQTVTQSATQALGPVQSIQLSSDNRASSRA
jgi:hypothetical protein